MTINYKTKSSLFNDHSEVLVNPVNTVGVMGKGLAKEFKNRYPKNYKFYRDYCDKKLLKVGKVLYFIDDDVKIINAATKNHWCDKSKLTDIESSIIEIKDLIVKHNITSVSIPALGCGLGGLDWNIVKPIMEKYLINVDCYVNIHLPH